MLEQLEDTFDSTPIRLLTKDQTTIQLWTDIKKNTWGTFVPILRDFHGNKRRDDYTVLVESLIENVHVLGWSKNIKIYFLNNHLKLFPANLGNVSDVRVNVFTSCSTSWETDINVARTFRWWRTISRVFSETAPGIDIQDDRLKTILWLVNVAYFTKATDRSNIALSM